MDTLLLRPEGQGYKYEIQLEILGCKLTKEELGNYLDQHFWGNSLFVEGNDKLMKIRINTDKPWEILAYCDGIGAVDATIKNRMQVQQGVKVAVKKS